MGRAIRRAALAGSALLAAVLGAGPAAGAPAWTTELVSTRLPVRVRFTDDARRPLAESTLPVLEAAWDDVVGARGYPAPRTDGDGGTVVGMVAYLARTPMGAGGGMAEWGEDVPETPRCDCSARLLVDEATSATNAGLAETVFHELVHTAQYALDCTEPPSAYEGFAIAEVHEAFPASRIVPGVVREFQAFPEYPLDYWTMAFACDGLVPCFPYQLGAALFPIFLRERFGGGPTFVAELFAAFAEDGTTTIGPPHPRCTPANAPDWLEGVDAFLAARGSSLEAAFAEFVVWRAAVGTHDDGAHFARGTTYAEPAVAATVTLPADGTLDVREYGTRYVELALPTGEDPVATSVDGDGAARWAAAVLAWRPGAPVEATPLAFEGPRGSLTLAVAPETTRLVLAVSQLDDGAHDADRMDYANARTFRYRVAVAAPPVVEPTPDAGHADALADTHETVAADTPEPHSDVAVTPDATLDVEADTAPPAPPASGGCATGAAPGAPWGLLLLLAGAAGRRRGPRRQSRS